ncbi:MAG: DMT family transporter, partial [Pseudoruegeria sp.]
PSGGGSAPSLFGAALMIPAAVGWGVYSLRGQMAADPLTATALNFNYAVAFVAVVFVLAAGQYITAGGAILAILSGAVTSGLGYALWYAILPRLEATVAAVAQLTVPIIAMAGGMVFLAEAPDQRFWIAAILVVSGVLISLIKRDAHK